MVALGRTLFAIHSVFLLLAAIFFFCSFAGFTGSGYVIASTILVILLWGVFGGLTVKAITLAYALAKGSGDQTQALAWTKWLFGAVTALSAFTGLGLAFLSFVGCGPYFLPGLYHWGGMIGTILGFLAFFLFLPLIVRWCVDSSGDYGNFSAWGWFVFVPLGVVVLWGGIWLGFYLELKGNINETEYKANGYKLPFPSGESSWVIQGNNSSLNHNNANSGQKFSWDFRRRCGTPVLAARAGKIAALPDDTHDEIGGPNNQIQIIHTDNTVAFYLHIQKGSVPARLRAINAIVNQGDEIAKVGCVGNSLTGHIHFMVRPGTTGTTTIGVTFTDVSDDNGIPRTFGSYTSGNRRVP